MTVNLNAGTAPGNLSDKQPPKEVKAAKDFESLLLGQILKSMREEGSSWLGTGDDQASDSAFGLGEQELAKALTAGGGLGLSKMIAEDLAKRRL
jgi:flagellar protein FlgJ